MNKPDLFSQFAQQASRLINQGPDIQQDIESKLQVLLQGALNKMNMVSRDEFDAQLAVLNRTRSKLEALESQLVELTAKLEEKA